MPYPQNWITSAQDSAGLIAIGLTVGSALARISSTTVSLTMATLVPGLSTTFFLTETSAGGSLYVGAKNTTVVLTHSGTFVSLGGQGTLRTLIGLDWFQNEGTNTYRAGVFCLRGTASGGGDNTFSGPCYTFAAAPVVAASASTWVLEKYSSGLVGTTVSLLASATVSVSTVAGRVFSVQLSWVVSAAGVQLIGKGASGVVSQFASYLSLMPTVSLTFLDTILPLLSGGSAASSVGLWVKDTQNGMLVTFDMQAASAV